MELTQWLIEQKYSAKVVLVTNHMIEVAQTAAVLAEDADLFQLSILSSLNSREATMAALKD